MTLIDRMIVLGFSKHEAEVYIALLEEGVSSTGPIIKKTGLHRMIVYNTLETLINKKLVGQVFQNNIKHFIPAKPDIIFVETQNKVTIAEDVVQQLQLLSKENESEIETRILYGEKGFMNNLVDTVQEASRTKSKTIRILGGGAPEKFYDTIGDNYAQYTKVLKKHKVKKLLLAYAPTIDLWKKHFLQEPANELRIGPRSLLNNTFTRIAGSLVSIEIYSHPIIVIQIRSKDVATGYRDNFDLLWEQGTRVERA